MTAGTWDAFLVNWLFWSGAAIGGVVFAALLDLTNAAWAATVRSIALRFQRFLVISLLAYAALVIHAPRVYGRALVALLIVYAAAFWFSRDAGRGSRARTPATVVLLAVYVAGFSLLANDVIMSLDPRWISTLFPAYTFVANVYGGIAMVATVVLASNPGGAAIDDRLRRDLGIVLVGFALLWIYLLWSQYLVIWYGNLPDETTFVIRRMTRPWRSVLWALLATRFVLPVAALMTRTGRRRVPFTLVSVACVSGFWMEYLMMIGPASTGLVAFSAAIVTLAFAACFFVAALWKSGAAPYRPPAQSDRSLSR